MTSMSRDTHEHRTRREMNNVTSRAGLKLTLLVGARGGEIAQLVRAQGTGVRIPVTAITFSCAAIHFPVVYNFTMSSKASSSHTMPIWCEILKILELVKCRRRLSPSHPIHPITALI